MAQQGGTTELPERVEAITQVAQGDNPDLFRYNIYQVEDLLSRLDYEDLNEDEAEAIAAALTSAYLRKTAVMPTFLATRDKIDYLLGHLDYQDCTHKELVAAALALAEAYGRKLSRFPGSPAGLVLQWPHRGTAAG